MSFSATNDASAGAIFQSAVQASGVDVSHLGQLAQVQLAVANAISGSIPDTVSTLTFTEKVIGTTALATPSAFAATTGSFFASTVSGATLMGFGTTHDVALKNRAGTTAFGVVANSTTVAAIGAMNVGGLLTITQGVANTGAVASTGYSLTGTDATVMISYAGTWNTSGNPTAFKLSITNTASGTTAALMDLLGGSAGTSSRFKVLQSGATTIAQGSVTGSSAVGALGISATWNTTGAPTAIDLAVTNTASDAASLLMNLKAGAAGATSMFKIGVTGVVTMVSNLLMGGSVGATADKVIALSNSATAPTTSVDLVHLYSADISAGHASLAIYSEEVVNAAVAVASTHRLPITINGTQYAVLLTTVLA